jgi:hypothetical protein
MPVMSCTRNWFRRAEAEWAAGAMICEGGLDAALTACDAMFNLNRYAKGLRSDWDQPRRREVYALKRRLIGELLQQFPCEVTGATQTLACWRCEGTGIWSHWAHYAATCWSCNGTGVYRQNELLLFTFTVGSSRYEWHQPREFWPTLTPESHRGDYHAPRGSYRPIGDRLYEILCETVDQWIVAQGLPGLASPVRAPRSSLWLAIRTDISDLRDRVRIIGYRVRRRWNRLIDRLSNRAEGHELPF